MSSPGNFAQITVDYKQLPNDYEEGMGSDGLYARRAYLTAWGDRFTFVNNVLGVSGMKAAGTGWQIQNIPYRYPLSPNLFARNARISPANEQGFSVDGPTGAIMTAAQKEISFEWARIDVEFRTPNWNYTSDQDPFNLNTFGTSPEEQAALLWAQQEIDQAAEWVQIPSSSSYWVSNNAGLQGQQTNIPMSRRVNVVTMNLGFERFPYLPVNWLTNYNDTLNRNTFLNQAPGTVMFCGAKTRREFNADGSVAQKLWFTFKCRPQASWNSFVSGPTTWDYISNSASGTTYTYKYADFLKLLQFVLDPPGTTPGT